MVFPFRRETFITSPSKAKHVLRWKGPKHTLLNDMKAEVEAYKNGVDASKTWTKDQLREDLEVRMELFLPSQDTSLYFLFPKF